MKVLIVGAAGTLGLALHKDLANHGHELRCLDVAPPRYDMSEALKLLGYDPQPPAAEWIYRNADNYKSALPLVDGMDAVAYVALAPDLANDAMQLLANIAVPLRLLHACVTSHVPKFVYASSVSVNGPLKGVVVTERTPPHLWGAYCGGKWMAEMCMRELTQQHGIRTIALRLGTICPHLRMSDNAAGPHTQVRVDVRDAARAFRLALENQNISHDVIHVVSQGEPVHCDPSHAREALGFAAEFNGAAHFEGLFRRQAAFQNSQPKPEKG